MACEGYDSAQPSAWPELAIVSEEQPLWSLVPAPPPAEMASTDAVDQVRKLHVLVTRLHALVTKLQVDNRRLRVDRDKARQNNPAFFDQFVSGRLLAQLSSRPGQSGGQSFTPFVLLARIMRAPFLSNRSAYAGVDAKPSVLGAGRADGYILEGKELDFYLRKLRESKRG